MTGHEYEHLVAAYLRRHGYNGVKVTQASGDYGVDVIASKGGHKYAVQCKYYSHPVGVSAVQEVAAGRAFYHCDRAMVVTNSIFTKAAEELALANNVVLLDGITSAGAGLNLPKVLKWVLIIGYAFFASAGVAACFDVIKGQPFGKAAHNVVSTLLVLLLPLWIWLGVRGFKRYHLQKKKAPASVAINPSAPVPVVSVAAISPYLDSAEAAVKLSTLSRISTPAVQRVCVCTYERATQIVDSLFRAALITPIGGTDSTGYEWTENAKKPS